MILINKHTNHEEELLDICEGDASKFELLSMTIDWGLQRIDSLSDDLLAQMKIDRDVYMIKIRKSFNHDNDLMILFSYKKGEGRLTLLAVRE